MNFIVYNVIYMVIFQAIYFIGEKTNLATDNMFDPSNMTFTVICFLVTLVISTLIHNKIKDYV